MPEGSANPARRWTAAAIAIVAAVWFCYAGAKHALASHYALILKSKRLGTRHSHRAGKRGNLVQLAMYRQLDFDNADIPLSISYFQRAIQLNPRSPYYKLDFAGALETAGKNQEADSYFQSRPGRLPDFRGNLLEVRKFSSSPGPLARSLRGNSPRGDGGSQTDSPRGVARLA